MNNISCELMRKTGAGVCGLLAFSLVGCMATVSKHVPPEAVASLPVERQLTLLDAESDLLAAQDARDAQEDRVILSRSNLEEARQLERTVNQSDTSRSSQVACAAIGEARARRELAERALEVEHCHLTTIEVARRLAEAKFELARAREVDAAGQGGRYSIRVADYARQAERIEAELQRRQQDEQRMRKAAESSRQIWVDASARLAQLTGGAQGSVWVQ